MLRRKALSAASLFILAGISLVLLNRFSFVAGPDKQQSAEVPAPRNEYVYELFDEETGVRTGKITADVFTTLPDGTADCSGVRLDLIDGEFGDVTLSCDRARVKLEEVGQTVAGKVVLSGNVDVKAVKDGRQIAAGTFEEISYDAGTKEVEASGELHISYGGGMSLSGTGLRGSVEMEALKVEIAKDVHVKVAQTAERPSFLGNATGDIDITSAGPMVFDYAGSTLSLSDEVRIESGDLSAEADAMKVGFLPSGAPGEALSGETSLTSIEMTGNAHIRRDAFDMAADSMTWAAETGKVRVAGAPARLLFRGSTIETDELEATLDEKGHLTFVSSKTPGKAVIIQTPGKTEDAADPAKAAVDVKASWRDSLLYDAANGSLSLSGDVQADVDGYRTKADHVEIEFEKGGGIEDLASGEASMGMHGLRATGDVSVTGSDDVELRAAWAGYDAATSIVTLKGVPATASIAGGTFSSDELLYSLVSGKLVSPGRAVFVITEAGDLVPGGMDTKGAIEVSAGKVEADLSGDAISALCNGGVSVDFEEGLLTCERMTVSNVSTKGKGNQGDVQIVGEGAVRFESGPVSAKGERVAFDVGKGVITLSGEGPERAEVAYAKTATVWTDEVTINTETYEVSCKKPQVVLSSAESIMGFIESTPNRTALSGSPKESEIKIYINAGGKLVLKVTPDGEGVLAMDGGVDGIRRDSQSGAEDAFASEKLTLQFKTEPFEPGTAFKPSHVAPTSAFLSGDVYVKYCGTKRTLEAKGDTFEWKSAGNRGSLKGDSAVVWTDDAQSQKAREFIYDFSTDSISVRGGSEGTGILELKR